MADAKKLLGALTDPKKLFRLVRSPRAIVGMLGLTFAFTVFRWGARVIKNGGTRLWIAIGILVIAIVIIVISKMREKKKAKQVEDSLLLEADSMVMTSSGAQRAANERAREELVTAIDALKRSPGRGGANALSTLPWFLVLGKANSGKSKLIRNSGLTFPGSGVKDKHSRGVGPGKSMSWWFTNQAIVLEANGRFADREDDSEARHDWAGILEVVRKARGEVPIQGIVVTVSAEDLIRLDTARLEEQARVLRQRLDATFSGLKAFTPVHLAVTKVDLVHGFEEFFADLAGNARDQALGATLDPEQAEEDPVRAFTREYEALYRSLCDRRLNRLASEDRAERRGRIYLFPLEFVSLRRKLRDFVKTLFEPNPYGERPVFRGFYFASGNVEGQPVEMVLNEVSRVIGLPPDLDSASDVTRVIDMLPDPEPSRASAASSRSDEPRFVRELFTRILPTSAALARPTEEATRRRRLRVVGLLGGGIAVTAILASLFIVSFARNRALVSSTLGLANEAALIPGNAANAGEVENRLRLLEPLRDQLDTLDRYDRSTPFTLGFGMYRGKAPNARARAVYMDRLAEVFLGPSRRSLENALFTSYPASPAEGQQFLDRYRAYLMLMEPARADTAFLAKQLVDLWSSPAAGSGGTEGLRDSIRRHVAYAWTHPEDVAYQSADLSPRNPALVDRAGVYIREFWRPENFYLAMLEQVNTAVPSFSVASIPGGTGLLTTDAEAVALNPDAAFVPGAFTAQGWRDEVARRIEESQSQLAQDWILKDAFQGQPLDMRDWLLSTYRADYVRHWAQFLAAVDVVSVQGTAPGAAKLRDLAQPGSPLVRLLEAAAANLRFRGDAAGGDSAAARMATIEDDFAVLHALFSVRGEGAEARRPVDEYLRTLGGVMEALRQLAESGDPGLTATQYAKQMLSDIVPPEAAVPASLRFVDRFCADILTGSEMCTGAMRTILRRPAEGGWGAVMREAQLYLDAAWGTSVWDPFRTLTGKYPFLESGPDAPMEEFNRFFAPGGVFWTFHDGELAPFLDREGNAKIVWRHGLQLGPEAQTALRKAHQFRDALFREVPGTMSFSFRVKPEQTTKVSGDPPYARTTILTVGGTRLVYDMGFAKETRLTWPGESQETGARVSATMDGPEPESIAFEGPWAFFRLLDRAQVSPRTESEYRMVWTLERRGSYAIAAPYEFRAATATNPFAPDFFLFECPRQLGPPPGGVANIP